MLTRRQFGFSALALAVSPGSALASPPAALTVYRSPSCGSSKAWVKGFEEAGFTTVLVELDDLSGTKRRLGVPDKNESCHTDVIAGYFVEGHVPIEDVRRLLVERPSGRGLSVPGMPVGSPGMEIVGVKAEPFQTLLVALDGSASVFASH